MYYIYRDSFQDVYQQQMQQQRTSRRQIRMRKLNENTLAKSFLD